MTARNAEMSLNQNTQNLSREGVTSNPAPAALSHLAGVTPYVIPPMGQDASEGAAPPTILSANENPYGCSPKAVDAITAHAADVFRYPQGGAHTLRASLGDTYDIEPDRIVCGSGSDELIQLLVRAYAGPGDEVLYPENAFAVYGLAARQAGAIPVPVTETNLTADVDLLLSRVTGATRIVFLANPNNPTGTALSASEIAHLHAGLPGNVLLVLDVAYAEYAANGLPAGYDDGFALACTAQNVVILRTFSKAYGLAGLRLGWAYAPDAVIDTVNRIRAPFNVNALALAAAQAALQDQDFIARSVRDNALQRARLEVLLTDLGVLAAPSVGNFVLMRCPGGAGFTAADIDRALQRAGIVVKPLAGGYPNLEDSLRITVGQKAAIDTIIDTLRKKFA